MPHDVIVKAGAADAPAAVIGVVSSLLLYHPEEVALMTIVSAPASIEEQATRPKRVRDKLQPLTG